MHPFSFFAHLMHACVLLNLYSGAGVGWLNDIMDEYPSTSRRSSITTTTTKDTTTTTTTTTTLMMVPSSSIKSTMKGNNTTDIKEQVKEEDQDVEA